MLQLLRCHWSKANSRALLGYVLRFHLHWRFGCAVHAFNGDIQYEILRLPVPDGGPNVVFMSVQRLRRWPNIKTTFRVYWTRVRVLRLRFHRNTLGVLNGGPSSKHSSRASHTLFLSLRTSIITGIYYATSLETTFTGIEPMLSDDWASGRYVGSTNANDVKYIMPTVYT